MGISGIDNGLKGNNTMLYGIIAAVIGLISGFFIGVFVKQYDVDKERRLRAKNTAQYTNIYRWLEIKQSGKNISEFLSKSGYRRIAVYGIKGVGRLFLNELEHTSIEITYVIDKNIDVYCGDIPIIAKAQKLDNTDAVVVIPAMEFEKIKAELSDKVTCPIISLNQILEGLI